MECLIGQRFADEDLAIISKVFQPEKFLKLLFQIVRPFSCYISDHGGLESGSRRADEVNFFQVTISCRTLLIDLTYRKLSGR